MIEPSAGEPEARRNVSQLQIRQLLEDLLRRESGGQEVKHVDDPDAHPADAGAPPALVGIYGNAVHQLDGLPHGALAGARVPGNIAPASGCVTSAPGLRSGHLPAKMRSVGTTCHPCASMSAPSASSAATPR